MYSSLPEYFAEEQIKWKRTRRIKGNVTRGTMNSRNSSKNIFCEYELWTWLKTFYGLKDTAKGDKKNSITLAQVALSFSWLACEYMYLSKCPVVSLSEMEMYIHKYPAAMLHLSFASFIPQKSNTNMKETIVDAYLLCQIRFTEVVNRKGGKKIKSISEYHNQCSIYAAISVRSSFVPENEKINLMIRWGVLIVSGKSAHLWRPVREAASLYKSTRGDEQLPDVPYGKPRSLASGSGDGGPGSKRMNTDDESEEGDLKRNKAAESQTTTNLEEAT